MGRSRTCPETSGEGKKKVKKKRRSYAELIRGSEKKVVNKENIPDLKTKPPNKDGPLFVHFFSPFFPSPFSPPFIPNHGGHGGGSMLSLLLLF